MRSLHMLDLSQIELGLRETCLWATFFDLDPLTARKEGWTHSLDLQKGRESTCIAARASPEMFAKNGDGDVGRSGIYRSSST